MRAWAVGQLVTGRASLELLADRAGRADRDQTGTQAAVWPEFAEYDCFSCHHSLRGLEDRPRSTLARRHAGDTHRVGGYDWGAWHMTMPSWLARLEAPEAAQPKLEPLQKLTATMSQPFPEPRLIMRDSQQAARVFDPWIERVARQHFDRADLKKQFVELASTAQTHTWDQAAQAYLACVAFHQARNPEGSSSLSAADQAVADALNRIFPGLRFKADERAKFNSPQDFDAARLGADFVKLAAAVNNLEP